MLKTAFVSYTVQNSFKDAQGSLLGAVSSVSQWSFKGKNLHPLEGFVIHRNKQEDTKFISPGETGRTLWCQSTVELQWIEHLWNHENMFETGVL